MIKDNLKFFIFSFAVVAGTSFFLVGCLPCLADEIIEQQDLAQNDYRENISNGDLTDNASFYQPFLNPITNWETLDEFDVYSCQTGDAVFNSDPYMNVYAVSAPTINDCLDPLVNKCYVSLREDFSNPNCIDSGVTAFPDLNFHTISFDPIYNEPTYCRNGSPSIANNVLCGISIESKRNPYLSGEETTTGVTQLSTSGYFYQYPAGYNFATGASTFPLWFKLWGTFPTVATSTGDVCDCLFTSTSTNIFDIMGNAIFCGLKSTACWAFRPDSGTIQNFATSTAILSQKFPLNTFFGLTSAVSNAMDTNDTMGGTLGVPMARIVNGHEQTYILPVISSSSMPKAIGQTNTTLFRNGLIWLGWIIVACLIFLIIFNL
jgi:hypothetical protein